MSKHRCPVCGATHKQAVPRCRLCGQDLTSASAVPRTVGGARVATAGKPGIAVIAGVAVAVVIVVAVGALLLGLTDDSKAVDAVTQGLPALQHTDDGWVTFEDTVGGLVAELPPNATRRAEAAPAALDGRADGQVTGQLTGWEATIGSETTLRVSYAAITPPPDGQAASATLDAVASDVVASIPGAKLTTLTETSFEGRPAALAAIRAVELDGQPATARLLLVLEGTRLHLIESTSQYADHPSFDRLLQGIRFTG